MKSDTGIDYDVALSFAGENREFVRRVAEYLKQNQVSVFYDEDEEVNLWGKDLFDCLDGIYRKRSRYVVMFISEPYARKMWTNHERQSAFARALQEKQEYILPARFDDTELPGLRPTIRYIDLRKETSDSFASKIVGKIKGEGMDRQSLDAVSSQRPSALSHQSNYRVEPKPQENETLGVDSSASQSQRYPQPGEGLTPAQKRSQKIVTATPIIDLKISGEWEATGELSEPLDPRKTVGIFFKINIVVEMVSDEYGKATGEYTDETGSYSIKYGEWRHNRYLTIFLEDERITLTGNYQDGKLWGPITMPVGDYSWKGTWEGKKRK